MRIMLDTNILISAGLFPNSRLSSVVMDIADQHNLVLSSRIIEELQRVFAQKFPQKKAVLDQFLCTLSYEVSYTPSEIDKGAYPAIRDEKDYPILASSIIANVDVLITGDKDFAEVETERPEIMTITEFERKYM